MNFRVDRETRIMACPAVRLSVEISFPVRWRPRGERVAPEPGPPYCSEDECELVEGPSCLLTILREEARAADP